MAWEWVAPVSTASVGIVGIVTTGLIARAARKSAEGLADAARRESRQLLIRSERLAVYERFLGALDDVQKAAIELQHRKSVTISDAQKKLAVDARLRLSSAWQALVLAAPQSVEDAAEEIKNDASSRLRAAVENDASVNAVVDGVLAGKLWEAMRHDLGYADSPRTEEKS